MSTADATFAVRPTVGELHRWRVPRVRLLDGGRNRRLFQMTLLPQRSTAGHAKDCSRRGCLVSSLSECHISKRILSGNAHNALASAHVAVCGDRSSGSFQRGYTSVAAHAKAALVRPRMKEN
ncbi:hypothetical protein [Burkholderia cepacia]|uniref:hypothetical protein n=1 Tax=Burkholderia cepacia TaxID=292 RepID=UPI00158B9A06|nr:hypothetical protein [Burkholderia cepacia]